MGKGAASACRTFFFWSAESALTHNGEGVAATSTGKPRCPLPAPSASHRRVTRFGSATEIEGLRDRQREGDQTMTNPVRYSDFELSEDELEWEYQPVCEQVGRMFGNDRSEEHTSELQSLMRISSAVFCLKKKKNNKLNN